MLLGVIGNPPKGLRSERNAFDAIERELDIIGNIVRRKPRRPMSEDDAWKIEAAEHRIYDIINELRKQIADGYHVNGRGIKTSDHVQAIIYRHRDDDQYYVHGFGDADLDLKVTGNELRIRGLEDDTEVQMFAQPDGSVRIVGRNGQRLWEDIE